MKFDLNIALAAFKRVNIEFQRTYNSLVAQSECCANAGARIERTANETEITAINVLFAVEDAQACRNLMGALWEAALPNSHWSTDVDECIDCARKRGQFERVEDGVRIQLLLNENQAEVLATQTKSTTITGAITATASPAASCPAS